MSAERMVSSGVGPREERSARSMLVFSSFLAMGSGSCTAVPLFTEMPRGVISIVRCGLVRDVQLYERALVVGSRFSVEAPGDHSYSGSDGGCAPMARRRWRRFVRRGRFCSNRVIVA